MKKSYAQPSIKTFDLSVSMLSGSKTGKRPLAIQNEFIGVNPKVSVDMNFYKYEAKEGDATEGRSKQHSFWEEE